MNYIDYDEACELVEKVKTKQLHKILVFMVGKEDCPACGHFNSEILPTIQGNISDKFGYPNTSTKRWIQRDISEFIEIYGIKIGEGWNPLFPPMRSPTFYFYTTGSETFPMMRENVPPPDALINEFVMQKRILDGESFYDVYAQKIENNS